MTNMLGVAAVLLIGAAGARAQQEDPKPEVVPATPLVTPDKAKAEGKAVAAMPMMAPAAAQAQGATGGGADAEGFEALEKEFAGAYRAWMVELQQLRGQQDVVIPADPTAAWYPRFRALADRGDVDARLWCLQNFTPGDATPAELRHLAWKGEALSLATAARAQSELALRLVSAVYGGVMVDGVGPEVVDEVLDYMLATVADDAVGARIYATRASRAEWDQDAEVRKTAPALYAALLERYPDSPEAKRAQGKLFAAANLQVGMVAPDFTGKDVDGNPIALSDYRGKVLVLDFWGFW